MGPGRSDCSFPKAYRLASSDDFRRVYRRGWRGRVGPFVWYARAGACKHPRLGLAVARKVVKRATDRARLKRVIRESFRCNRNRMPPLDIVVSVRRLPHDLYEPGLGRVADELWTDVLSVSADAPQRS